MSENRVMHREKSAAELRKINKPLVEKKRRERINNCLETLKTLILDATKKDTIRYSKLEKADILEMTVKHLREVARSSNPGTHDSQPSTITKYRAGYNECATEVTRYLAKDETLAPELRMRLLNHLASRMQNVNTIANSQLPPAGGSTHPYHQVGAHAVPGATPLTCLPGFNQNVVQPAAHSQYIMRPVAAAQVPMLVPTRLPNGQVAYVLSDNQKPSTGPGMDAKHSMMTSTPINKRSKASLMDMNISDVSSTPQRMHNQSSLADSGIGLDDSKLFKTPARVNYSSSSSKASATITSPLSSPENSQPISIKQEPCMSPVSVASCSYSLISSPSPQETSMDHHPVVSSSSSWDELDITGPCSPPSQEVPTSSMPPGDNNNNQSNVSNQPLDVNGNAQIQNRNLIGRDENDNEAHHVNLNLIGAGVTGSNGNSPVIDHNDNEVNMQNQNLIAANDNVNEDEDVWRPW